MNTVTTKKCLMRTRTQKVMVESQELQEVNPQRTRPRRLMNHAGTGLRASADMETNATNAMILIYSTLLQIPKHQAQRLLLHLSMNGGDDEGTFHKVASNVIKKKVRFDESKTYVQTYVKKDFVKCNGSPKPSPKVMVRLVSPPIR